MTICLERRLHGDFTDVSSHMPYLATRTAMQEAKHPERKHGTLPQSCQVLCTPPESLSGASTGVWFGCRATEDEKQKEKERERPKSQLKIQVAGRSRFNPFGQV